MVYALFMNAVVLALVLQAGVVPTSEYGKTTIEGFTVMIHPNLEADSGLRDRMVVMLKGEVRKIHELVPAPAFKKIQTTKIWLDKDSKSCVAAAYHPSAVWLKDHGFNVDMAEGVELGNAKNVLDWSKLNQPFMVLHELAHSYHHRFLGYDNRDILAAYDAAKKNGKYEDVLKKPSGHGRHYGLNNEMEFFAETTESYFGMNDFQPFNRVELKTFDPVSYAMVRKAWGD